MTSREEIAPKTDIGRFIKHMVDDRKAAHAALQARIARLEEALRIARKWADGNWVDWKVQRDADEDLKVIDAALAAAEKEAAPDLVACIAALSQAGYRVTPPGKDPAANTTITLVGSQEASHDKP